MKVQKALEKAFGKQNHPRYSGTELEEGKLYRVVKSYNDAYTSLAKGHFVIVVRDYSARGKADGGRRILVDLDTHEAYLDSANEVFYEEVEDKNG